MDKLVTLQSLQKYDSLIKDYIHDIHYNIEDLLSYGVEWDITVSSPKLTRIGNPLLHASLPIQSQYRGCIWDPEEQKIVYYLDPNDWSRKADGTASKRDGTDGVVRVHTPKFYAKSGSNGNKRWVRESLYKIDDTWVEIPEMVIDAYRPTLDRTNNKFMSIINTDVQYRGGGNDTTYDQYLDTDPFRTCLGKSATNITRANARTYATNAGSKLITYFVYKFIFYWNWVIEYATFNSQDAFNSELDGSGYHQGGMGAGVTNYNWNYWTYYNNNNPLTPCGYCDEFGNGTGVKEMSFTSPTAADGSTTQSFTFQVSRWRCFDNIFGDIWTNLDGCLCDTPITGASDASVLPTFYVFNDITTDSLDDIDKAHRAVKLPHNEGLIKEFDLGGECDIIPKTIGGSATTYQCDYYWVDYNDTPETLLVGGRAHHGSAAGLGAFHVHLGVGLVHRNVGFRTFDIV